ncbi:MAG: patatin-like phospholipase family protein [Limisphaerales bacterium]
MPASPPTEKSVWDLRRAELLSSLARPPQAAFSRAGRLSALASASRRLPDRLITESLAEMLAAVTGERVLLLLIVPSDAGATAKVWSPLHSMPNNGFAFADQLQHLGGFDRLTLRVTNHLAERSFLTAFLGHCTRHFGHVLVHVDADAPRLALAEAAVRAGEAYVLTQQTVDSLFEFNQLDRQLRAECAGEATDLKLVLCLEHDELPQPAGDFLKQVGQRVHLNLRESPATVDDLHAHCGGPWPVAFKFDLRRFAREIGRCRVGLALSSGGAKGLAHIGVLQVLEENGIEVDMVAGTSMGAYIGALWAFGHDGQFLERKARELEGKWGLLKLIDPAFPPRRGFINGRAIRERLERSIGAVRFEQLARPLRVVTTRFDTLERVVFDTGAVSPAVLASCAIPSVFVPVRLDGETYIDGGVSDPLPVDVLREAGVERIIAVTIIPTPAFLRCAREHEREQGEVKRRRFNFLRLLNQQVNYFAYGNILDVTQRAVIGGQIRAAEDACRQADVVLRPLACDSRWHDFSNPGKYISLGRRVAEENLADIKQLVNRKEPTHEHQTPHHELAAAA